jgi:DDE superfamily endonuclease
MASTSRVGVTFIAGELNGLVGEPVQVRYPHDLRVLQPRNAPMTTSGMVRTNLFAALNVGTGEVFGECKPTRDGENFLAFLKKAVKPHVGRDIHVVLDNLSTHTTPDVCAWLEKNQHIHLHFTPVGSSWLNQIETWFWHHHSPVHPSGHLQ